jgi:hypothetical protein
VLHVVVKEIVKRFLDTFRFEYRYTISCSNDDRNVTSRPPCDIWRSTSHFRHEHSPVHTGYPAVRGTMLSSSSTTLFLSLFIALEGFQIVHGHDDNNIASRLQEVVNEQQPISNNYAHPMKQSRRWGTITPKLESAGQARKRHDRRVSQSHIRVERGLQSRSPFSSKPARSTAQLKLQPVQRRLPLQRPAMWIRACTRLAWVGRQSPVRT